MIKSMTAYGRSLRLSSLGKWLIELHVVNKKILDFYVFLPKDLLQFDLEIRKWISASLKRGQVTVKISFYPNRENFSLLAEVDRLKVMKEEMDKVCLEIGCFTQEVSFPFLYEQFKTSSFESLIDEELLRSDLRVGVQEALQACLKMKEAEGASLKMAFQGHLSLLKEIIEQIEKKTSGAQERYKKKLFEKFSEYKEATAEDQERLFREVFLLAQKSDVTEEIARMHSHLNQFTLILESEEPVGRTMEFLLQEMGREVNTLSAKSDDLEISYAALKVKGELEKMREQAQNIE